MALKKKKVNTVVEGTEIPKEVTLKSKVGKPNISQAGLIRALKKREYSQISDTVPFKLVKDTTTILVHEATAAVEGTEISVPLGKGAIDQLMKQLKTK